MSRFVELGEGDNFDIDLSEIQAVVFPVEGEEVTIEPKTEEQVILPTSDKKLIKKATVKAVTSEIDENIKPENIVLGKTILGVAGNVAPDKPDQTKTTIPTKERQVVRADAGFELVESIVEPIPEEYVVPQGELLIDENNKTVDVKNYATAKVEIAEKPKGEFFVKVIDYDGTLLDEVWLNNGEVYTLPTAPPEKERLLFQEWSCSQQIVDGNITIDDNNVMVGATYIPKSGLTEVDIEINKYTGNSFTFDMAGNKNWGDGTSDDLTTHEYADYGKYTITCDGTTIDTQFFGSGELQSKQAVIAVYLGNVEMRFATNAFSYCRNLKEITLSSGSKNIPNNMLNYCNSLKAVVFPNKSKPSQYLFRNSINLQEVVFSYGTIGFGNNTFGSNYQLKTLVIPQSVTSLSEIDVKTSKVEYVVIPKNVKSISSNALNYYNLLEKLSFKCSPTSISTCLNYLYSLRELTFPDSVQTLEGVCTDCFNLERVKFPKNLTKIYGFNNCYSLKICDFTECVAVPTATGGLFNSCYNAKIVVPDALYDEWIVATNWSARANQIYKASEVEL